MQHPDLAYLFAIDCDLDAPQVPGGAPGGTRLIYMVKGGRFEGGRVKGVVLPGGGDWMPGSTYRRVTPAPGGGVGLP